MTPYPNSFPQDSCDVLTGMLQGNQPADLGQGLHAAWDLVGFGLSQVTPDQINWTAPVSVEDLKQALSPGKRASINWTVVVPAIVSLLQNFFPMMSKSSGSSGGHAGYGPYPHSRDCDQAQVANKPLDLPASAHTHPGGKTKK